MTPLFFPLDKTRFHASGRDSMLNQRKRALAASAVILVLLSACATTTTAQLDAFNALKTIRVSVVAAVNVFNVGYQAGQFNEVQRTELGTLYNKYIAADAVAATALQATTTTDPATIVQSVTVLAADVLNFIQLLKTPAPTPTPSAVTP